METGQEHLPVRRHEILSWLLLPLLRGVSPYRSSFGLFQKEKKNRIEAIGGPRHTEVLSAVAFR